jgi:hypothetical protein
MPDENENKENIEDPSLLTQPYYFENISTDIAEEILENIKQVYLISFYILI